MIFKIIKERVFPSLCILVLFIISFHDPNAAFAYFSSVSQAELEIEEMLQGDYHPYRILVKFKEGVTQEEAIQKSEDYTSQRQKVFQAKHGPLIHTVNVIPETTYENVNFNNESTIGELRGETRDDMHDAMLKYILDEDVELVDVAHKGELHWNDTGAKTYSDDYGSEQAPATDDHWYWDAVKLPEAWDDMNCATGGADCGGDSSVTVAVLDTGMAYEDYTATYEYTGNNYTNIDFDSAPELTGINLYTNASDPYNNGDEDGNGVCDDYHGFDAEQWLENYNTGDSGTCNASSDIQKEGHANDDYGHGTYAGGMIASLTNNAASSVSAAHDVTIMPIKLNVPYTGIVYTDAFYYSVVYAVDYGADVINASLGWCSGDAYLESAVEYAEAAGVTMVISSGNSTCGWSTPLCYPAQYTNSNVIAVGAVNSNNSRSSYSQYGSSLDIVAPVGEGSGEGDATWQQILNCAWSCSSASNFTAFKNLYSSGTSFAAPQVAAAAALIKSRIPGISSNSIVSILISSATDIGSSGRDDYTGYGLLNLEALWNQDFFYNPDSWYHAEPGNWSVNNSVHMEAGDYDGDGDSDLAVMYRYNNAAMKIWVFESNGTNAFTDSVWISKEAGNWDVDASVHIEAGDYDGDGDSDLAVMYRYNNAAMKIWVFESNGTDAFTDSVWVSREAGNWDVDSSIHLKAGDYDGDGNSDLAVMYRYNNAAMKIWVFESNGTDVFTDSVWVSREAGNWDVDSSVHMKAGDYDGDNLTDLSVMYGYDNSIMKLWVFKSNGSSSFSTNVWYNSGRGNWNADRSKHMVVGDFDSSLGYEIGVMYDYFSSEMKLWVFTKAT